MQARLWEWELGTVPEADLKVINADDSIMRGAVVRRVAIAYGVTAWLLAQIASSPQARDASIPWPVFLPNVLTTR